MSIDADDAWERSRDEPAFSNNDGWEFWAENWCYRCKRDINQDCPLVVIAYCGRTPAEWLVQPEGSPDKYHCVMFRGPDDPGGEPEPIPDPPDQLALMERPEAQVRMFVRPELSEVRP